MRSTILLLLLICCFHASAQQKYIEVSISDTILAKADWYSYRILLNAGSDASDYTASRKKNSTEDWYDQRQTKTALAFDTLLQKLKANGFRTDKPSLGDSINVYKREYPFLITRVITHSLDSLRLLGSLLKDQKNLVGYLESSAATNDSVFQKRLLKKILDKARAKAETIAVFSDLHVRGVISVSENRAEADKQQGGWTSYPPLSQFADMIPGWHTNIGPLSGLDTTNPDAVGWYLLSGNYTIRFWVE